MAVSTTPRTADSDWREQPSFAWRIWLRSLTFKDQLIYGLLLVLVGIGFGYLMFAGDGGYTVNLFTEVLSVFFTIFVLDILNRRREEQREERELKARLLRDVRSSVNDVAARAIHEMRERGWLTGTNGLLKGARLSNANLQGANLVGSNLEGAILVNANLQRARLTSADLRCADLTGANAQKADLRFAQLQGAYLQGIQLQGANLGMAKLKNANLLNAAFDTMTTLPNSIKWSPAVHEYAMMRSFDCVFVSSEDEEVYAAWEVQRCQSVSPKHK